MSIAKLRSGVKVPLLVASEPSVTLDWYRLSARATTCCPWGWMRGGGTAYGMQGRGVTGYNMGYARAPLCAHRVYRGVPVPA